MNGPQHYAAAEGKLGEFTAFHQKHQGRFTGTPSMLIEAQVHATLALAAATVDVATGGADRGPITGSSPWLEAIE